MAPHARQQGKPNPNRAPAPSMTPSIDRHCPLASRMGNSGSSMNANSLCVMKITRCEVRPKSSCPRTPAASSGAQTNARRDQRKQLRSNLAHPRCAQSRVGGSASISRCTPAVHVAQCRCVLWVIRGERPIKRAHHSRHLRASTQPHLSFFGTR